MPSEKVTNILISKTDLAVSEISALSEPDAWNLVYSLTSPKKPEVDEICFTGFRATEKRDLAELASTSGMRVVGSVTKKCTFLVCGENAGPSKLEKAAQQGTHLLSEEGFRLLLETGEISD